MKKLFQKKINNLDGSLSVEALISISVFLILIVFFINMITVVSLEDKIDQSTVDLISELEIYNYLYEKIGFDQILNIDGYKDRITDYIGNTREEWLEYLNFDKLILDKGKESFLSTIAKEKIEDILEKNRKYSRLLNYDFSISDDIVTIKFSYSIVLIMDYKVRTTHFFEKKMWLFGDNSEIYPNDTLLSKLIKEDDELKNITVYKTKTGSKYHLEGCFYLRRSTTDKENIESLSMYKAKLIYQLEPCKRCIKEK